MLEQAVAFLATTDADRSRGFYEDVLGLRLLEETEWAMVFDLCGIHLRIQKVERVVPPPYTSLGMRVTNLDSTMRDLREKGIEFMRFDGLPQDEHGVWKTPGGARVAWFRDPDGHVLSIASPG